MPEDRPIAVGRGFIKIHCFTCHRVDQTLPQHFNTGHKGKYIFWHVGSDRADKHFCQHRCWVNRDTLKLIRDPLTIPTPVRGNYAFKLGFWAAMQGYDMLNRYDSDYQRGYVEAMELRYRYYTRRE